jgi:hypothetical protein
VTLERVEVTEAGGPKNRRAEPEVRGVEDRVVNARIVARVDPGHEPLDELDESLDPEAAGEVVVQVRDRLAMEGVIVRQVSIGGHGAPSGDLQVDPVAWLWAVNIARSEGRRKSPRRTGRRVHLPNMGQLHRRMGDVGGMARV